MTLTATPPLVTTVLPFGKSAGKATDKVLFDTTTGAYHCADCAFTSATFAGVFGHRSTHGKGNGMAAKAAKRVAGHPSAALDLVAQLEATLLEQTAKGDTVPAEWKTRALKAERKLKALKSALN